MDNAKKMIYMDYQATTPTDPRVVEKMLPYFNQSFGNPHSRTHEFGWNAEEAVEDARTKIARVINADPKEIIFTSGATESNNLALKGLAEFYGDKKKHIITLATEHKCILDTCRHLQQSGFEVTYLPVAENGLVDVAAIKAAMREDTLVVSVMAVNNEIGVIQQLKEIGELCRQNKVFFHTDAAQAFGKIELDVKEMNIDLMSISSHKCYGPMGVGALYVGRSPRVRISAIINGGGQERGMRSGTLPTPLIVGFGEAAEIAHKEMKNEREKLQKLFDKFVGSMLSIPHVFLNGDMKKRFPGNVNLSFACIEGESMIGAIKELAVSSGSACTSASLEPSYILRALGVDEELAHTSIRFGFGRFTTEEDVEYAIKMVTKAVERLRELSPLWEMLQQGIDLKSINWSEH
ncbi:MAG: IscS subfamily cysteine desulfurase [Alphaproteobacteria bacterium]|jgi:cysteine desulfurase|nr:IscS subfamily cysteine desulfurase [Candidatus Jidaibacter sp.]